MEYRLFSHRYALSILETEPEFAQVWDEIQTAISNVTEDEIIQSFLSKGEQRGKSISAAINELLKKEFKNLGWASESPIFQDPNYNGGRDDAWRLDFAKDTISVEVAFNHSGVIAWNLLKPVLAGELNHVDKAIQTKIGVIICATSDMRIAGGFDNAVGTFEKFVYHLPPLNNQLSVPLLIIGLEAPKTFRITQTKRPNSNSKIGSIEYINELPLDM